MPRAKVTFKETVLDLELENVEVTIGPEILKAGKLKARLDVADLLRVQLPELRDISNADGVMFLNCGQKKIMCIKEIRGLTGWDLKTSKLFVESAPKLLRVEDLLGHTAEHAFDVLRRLPGIDVAITEKDGPVIPTVLDKLREVLVEAMTDQAK